MTVQNKNISQNCREALEIRIIENPKVMWFDIECEEEVFIADSFKNFLNGLISDELIE
jgi:hypothetical protein